MIQECNSLLFMAIETRMRPQGTWRPAPRGHEERDANVKWIFGLVGFLAVTVIVIQFGMGAMLRGMKKKPAPADLWRLVRQPASAAPGQPSYPRLQLSAPADLQAFRAREENELNTYGWVDRTSGIVRVPIDRAMDLLLEKGLPARTGTNEGPPGPSSYDLIQQRSLERRPGSPK